MIVARSVSEARLRRASRSSSLTAAPAARTSSRPAAFELPDVRQGGEALGVAACRMMFSWWADSPNAATAPESPRFQATWEGEEVS